MRHPYIARAVVYQYEAAAVRGFDRFNVVVQRASRTRAEAHATLRHLTLQAEVRCDIGAVTRRPRNPYKALTFRSK